MGLMTKNQLNDKTKLVNNAKITMTEGNNVVDPVPAKKKVGAIGVQPIKKYDHEVVATAKERNLSPEECKKWADNKNQQMKLDPANFAKPIHKKKGEEEIKDIGDVNEEGTVNLID